MELYIVLSEEIYKHCRYYPVGAFRKREDAVQAAFLERPDYFKNKIYHVCLQKEPEQEHLWLIIGTNNHMEPFEVYAYERKENAKFALEEISKEKETLIADELYMTGNDLIWEEDIWIDRTPVREYIDKATVMISQDGGKRDPAVFYFYEMIEIEIR